MRRLIVPLLVVFREISGEIDPDLHRLLKISPDRPRPVLVGSICPLDDEKEWISCVDV